MQETVPTDVLAIRTLNDNLRQTRTGGQVMLSPGIAAQGERSLAEILALVATFNEFTKENDPYGEHDCAVVSWDGRRVLFKIDYYDPTLQFCSDDPTDPEKTRRIMTVMFASEY